MNKNFLQSIVLLLIISMGLSCSRKKDKWTNRNWHDLTTKNNTLYNGRVAFQQGKEDIVRSYKDNFWETLPVERLIVSEDVRLPNEVLNENFDKAEEKAAKAIQKHSMLINDRERNPKMDESFLLLGKARYNEQRFIPALEAFNYILYKYATSDNINHAKVWRAKTNIRLDNNEKAIKDLTKMIEDEFMKPQDYADATSMLSQAYINLKSLDTAAFYINKAAVHTTNNEEKGRYYYIKGQLLNELGLKDSANYAFDQVIDLKRRTPRRYMMNAYMAQARNFNYEEDNKEEFLELLTDLEEDRENRPFLDMIYHQKAEYFMATDFIDVAVDYYNKSLRQDSEDQILESLNYKTLGDVSFDTKEYAESGAYYDSTLERMLVNSKKYRVLKKKRVNLDDVILYEGIAQKNDSILTIAAMSPDERLAFYKKYTDSIKLEATLKAAAEEIQRIKDGLPAQQRFNQSGTAIGGVANGPKTSGGKFYFYNPTIVSFGKTTFKKVFGNRDLQDNWRIASVSNSQSVGSEKIEELEKYDIDKDPVFDPETYISQIPTDEKFLDSLKIDRNFAYYQLGVIYKEKFQEYQLAVDKFEGLLENNPEERLIVPSKYNLYKIYQLQNEESKAALLKQDIVNNYPETSYAKILLNPEKALENDKNSPEAIYNRIYKDFKDQKYASVIRETETYATKFTDEEFAPKFELLKAQALGRYKGFEAYKKRLNYIALNYPQSPEGKKAQLMYETAIPQMESAVFQKGLETENNHKLVYTFASINKKQAEELKALIETIIAELKYDRMQVSLDFYKEDQLLVVVHTKRNKLGSEGLGELISLGKVEDTREADLTKWNRKKKYYKKVKAPYFVIASPNYRIIQIHKNLESFLTSDVDEALEPELKPEQ